NVDRGYLQHVAAAFGEPGWRRDAIAKFVLGHDLRFAGLDDCCLCGCATHVEHNQVARANSRPQSGGASNATSRTRTDSESGPIPRRFDAHHATVGGHHLDGGSYPKFGKSLGEPRQIAAHSRQEIRIHDGRRCTLVLLYLRQNLAGGGDKEGWGTLAKNGRGAALVHVIDVRIDKADGDGLNPFAQEFDCGVVNRRFIEWRDNSCIGADALDGLQAPPARYKRLWLAPGQIKHARRADAADLKHITEAAGGQQACARANLL